jgi:predicted PurR-regulated permease PerM
MCAGDGAEITGTSSFALRYVVASHRGPPRQRRKGEMPKKRATVVFLSLVAALAVYLCYLIAKPFLSAIIAAIVIAIVFFPLHARMQRLIPQRNPAAALSTVLVLVVLMVPALVLGVAVSKEITETYQSLSKQGVARVSAGPDLPQLMERPLGAIGRYVDLSGFDVRATLLRWLEQTSRFLLAIGAAALSNIFSFAVNLVVVFITLFFLFREGARIRQRVAALLPLSAQQVERLFTTINDTVVANVYGGLAVAAAQGCLTGLAFWVLGLPSPIMWGVLTAVASLVPVIGSAMIWVPASLVLLAGGHWGKALLLLGWGAAVVGQVDTLVRPYVIGKQVKVHTLLLFFALLGGVKAFGIMGLFIGPVVLSVTMAVFAILEEVTSSSQSSQGDGPPASNSRTTSQRENI